MKPISGSPLKFPDNPRMAIGNYLKIIGRGKDGAAALDRTQATDLFSQILDGQVTDLEIGAFCVAMRIKGESTEEMAGFLDATHARLQRIPRGENAPDRPVIILPSYNGARRLPLLTPLLALLLAREGFAVVIHGTPTESRRIFTTEVLAQLGIHPSKPAHAWGAAGVRFVPTEWLHSGLHRLLEVRRTIQLRNPAHSLVKLMNPCEGPCLLVSSYTHPEYAHSMRAVLLQTQGTGLLLRGTEGEAVADARRLPAMCSVYQGVLVDDFEAEHGSVSPLLQLPDNCDAAPTAEYIQRVLAGDLAVPAPIVLQVQRIVNLASRHP